LIRDFSRIFGTTSHQGQVIFFDAFPLRVPDLKVDVLTPHYGNYYRDNEPPADYINPVLTYFLTVDKGAPFQFALASKDTSLVAKAKYWLTGAFNELGIGGKTAAGYGFMR
jgi:CRISPR-associated protein Cmr6